ncbi:MAG TPA: carboxymuconolactone decarboxylase family protein [Ilumatobacteraceae bacterium]|nr:carboxymuconolactone decarboxylase family protein [Ilumatobacteraceae bacterium]
MTTITITTTTTDPTTRTEQQESSPRFTAHTPATATGRARDALSQLWDRHGDNLGAMTRTMAGSPSLLDGYLDLSRAMKRSALSRRLSEQISLSIQQQLDCAMCLAAHTSAARAAGLSDDDIALARAGTATDPAAAAIIAYATRVHQAPVTVTRQQIDLLRRLGHSDRQLLDVVGLVALNHLTGAFNLVAGLHPEQEIAS